MSIRKDKAFSLPELLIVIAVIAVMVAVLVTGGHSLQKQADLRNAKNTLLVLSAALEKFHERHGTYPFVAPPYLPVDASNVNGFSGYTRDTLAAMMLVWMRLDSATAYTFSIAVDEQKNYQASIEGLYIALKNDAQTFEMIGAIPDKYLTVKDAQNEKLTELFIPDVTPAQDVLLTRIVDPWGTPYRYIYEVGNGVAKVESAGPDGKFARTPPGVDPAQDKYNLDNISY